MIEVTEPPPVHAVYIVGGDQHGRGDGPDPALEVAAQQPCKVRHTTLLCPSSRTTLHFI